MRSLWQSLHNDLVRTIETLSFQKRFETSRYDHRVLHPFPDPQSLLGFLHTGRHDPEQNNRVLEELIAMAQGGETTRDCGTVLTWLALWPGLDALYRRLLRHFSQCPEELVSEICDRLSQGIQHLDLDKVQRIAATLLRNLERDIYRMLHSRWLEVTSRVELPAEDTLQVTSAGCDGYGMTAALLLDLLTKCVGEDSALVMAVTVNGNTQSEAARYLGISPEAARKRYQRAIQNLQTRVGKIR